LATHFFLPQYLAMEEELFQKFLEANDTEARNNVVVCIEKSLRDALHKTFGVRKLLKGETLINGALDIVSKGLSHGKYSTFQKAVADGVAYMKRANSGRYKEGDPLSFGNLNRFSTDLIVVWDPSIVSSDDYAELIKCLGDVVRSHGGLGVELLENSSAPVECQQPVTA
jgi:hypothetical protein